MLSLEVLKSHLAAIFTENVLDERIYYTPRRELSLEQIEGTILHDAWGIYKLPLSQMFFEYLSEETQYLTLADVLSENSRTQQETHEFILGHIEGFLENSSEDIYVNRVRELADDIWAAWNEKDAVDYYNFAKENLETIISDYLDPRHKDTKPSGFEDPSA